MMYTFLVCEKKLITTLYSPDSDRDYRKGPTFFELFSECCYADLGEKIAEADLVERFLSFSRFPGNNMSGLENTI